MTRSISKVSLLVLALFLLSQISLTVHAASHLASDQTASCQLCIGYHNGGHAPAAAVPPVEVVPARISAGISLPGFYTSTTLFSYQQRAPPSFS